MKEVVKLKGVRINGPYTDVIDQEVFRFHYEKRPGIKSVNWFRRRRDGEVVMNNHEQVIGYAEPFQVNFSATPVDVWKGFEPPGALGATLYYTPPDPYGTALSFMREHMQQLDTTSAIARANSPELDALTAIGEARESISMVKQLAYAARHPISEFTKTAESVLKSPTHAYKHGASLLADLRLLWRYGINPYYQQIKNLLDDIKVRRFSRIKWGDFSITKKVQFDLPFFPGWLPHAYGGYIPYTQEVTYSSHQILKLALSLDQVLDKFFSFSVPQTVWELTRFSFVVDWFVNVGDFIAAYEDTLNINQAGVACISHLVIVNKPEFHTPAPKVRSESGVRWYKRLITLNVTGQSRLIMYRRDITDRPRNYIKLGKSDNFDLTHQLDGLALGWQAIKDKAVSNKTLLQSEEKLRQKAAQSTLTNHLEFSAALKNNTNVLARKRPIKSRK